jgi:hypothetical protein
MASNSSSSSSTAQQLPEEQQPFVRGLGCAMRKDFCYSKYEEALQCEQLLTVGAACREQPNHMLYIHFFTYNTAFVGWMPHAAVSTSCK